jgi:hypothetical protein
VGKDTVCHWCVSPGSLMYPVIADTQDLGLICLIRKTGLDCSTDVFVLYLLLVCFTDVIRIVESGTFLNCEGSGLYRLQSACKCS